MLKRELICSFAQWKQLKELFPKRKVEPSPYVLSEEFFYFGLGGHVRQVKTANRTIWECDLENPPMMKRIR